VTYDIFSPLYSGRVVGHVQRAAGSEPALGERTGTGGLAVEEPDAHREDRVEPPVVEIERLERRDEELGPTSSTWTALRRAAAAIIFGERSTAVSRPRSRRSHTYVAATP
jgi:hypothetical protein